MLLQSVNTFVIFVLQKKKRPGGAGSKRLWAGMAWFVANQNL